MGIVLGWTHQTLACSGRCTLTYPNVWWKQLKAEVTWNIGGNKKWINFSHVDSYFESGPHVFLVNSFPPFFWRLGMLLILLLCLWVPKWRDWPVGGYFWEMWCGEWLEYAESGCDYVYVVLSPTHRQVLVSHLQSDTKKYFNFFLTDFNVFVNLIDKIFNSKIKNTNFNFCLN